MRRRLATLLAVGSLLAITAADEPTRPTAYRVTVDGNMKITSSLGPTLVRRTTAEFDYRVLRREGGVDVALDRFALRVLANGQEMDFLDMSRSRFILRRADRDVDLQRDQAPPAMLRVFEQFDPPLARIELAPDGGEVSRKEKEQDGAVVEAHAARPRPALPPEVPRG